MESDRKKTKTESLFDKGRERQRGKEKFRMNCENRNALETADNYHIHFFHCTIFEHTDTYTNTCSFLFTRLFFSQCAELLTFNAPEYTEKVKTRELDEWVDGWLKKLFANNK